MRAYRALTPGYVWWFSPGEPDYTAARAPHPLGELSDIIPVLTLPTSGGGTGGGGIGSDGVALVERGATPWFDFDGAYADRPFEPERADFGPELYGIASGGGLQQTHRDTSMQSEQFSIGIQPTVV
jgi:hypothetical protein